MSPAQAAFRKATWVVSSRLIVQPPDSPRGRSGGGREWQCV